MSINVQSGRPGRSAWALTLVLLLVLGVFAAAVSPPPANAQAGLTLTTPYPAVSAQPDGSVSFPLTLDAAEQTRVDMAVEGVPDGWTATIRGGGNEVQSVFVTPGAPPELTLDIGVAVDAAEGPTQMTVTATARSESVSLPITVNVASAAGGSVTLEADFPSVRGPVDSTFSFTLQLSNNTPQELTFSLQGTGPPGWEVSVQPTGQTTAASVPIEAGGTQALTVEAVPPVEEAAGLYPIVVEAVAGGRTAAAELAVEITGRVEMQFTTPDQVLSTTASAGTARNFDVTVLNLGTAPLQQVTLSGSGPTDWTVTFDLETVEGVAPGAAGTATAVITPSGDAISGDYVVTLTATAEEATETMEVRVTVETPPVVAIIGLALIAAVFVGLALVFRRYGRR